MVSGQGLDGAKILFVGEAPGETEDQMGLPFQGRSGKFLKKLLRETGFDPRTVYITNAVKCRPPKNRKPTKQEIQSCKPWLEEQIEILKPACIVCVGHAAAVAILGAKSSDRVKELMGQWHSLSGLPVRVIPHPSYLMQHGRRDERAARGELQEILRFYREEAWQRS